MKEPFVLLARVADPNLAHLLGARLEAEGIESRLRGEALGPYRLNVGAMAVTEIWIPERALEEARLVLLAAEADAAVSGVEPIARGPSAEPGRSWIWWMVAALLTGVVFYARLFWFQ